MVRIYRNKLWHDRLRLLPQRSIKHIGLLSGRIQHHQILMSITIQIQELQAGRKAAGYQFSGLQNLARGIEPLEENLLTISPQHQIVRQGRDRHETIRGALIH
jgi:hypothetical protein